MNHHSWMRGCLILILLITLQTRSSLIHAKSRHIIVEPGTGQDSTKDEELARSGYAKEVSLSSAVEDFNKRAKTDMIGRKQPKLTVKEVVAAIRAWNRDVDTINDSAFLVFQTIAKSKMMPRGSFIRFIPGVIAINGYDVEVWWIDLQIGLDKYPTDLADVPMYARRIRTVYIDSKLH